eukprot:g2386.t1
MAKTQACQVVDDVVPLSKSVLTESSTLTFKDICDWSTFDIFELADSCAKGDNPPLFPLLFEVVLGDSRGGFGTIDTLKVPRKQLHRALLAAQNSYDNPLYEKCNPYHHALHGADVFCSFVILMRAVSATKPMHARLFSPHVVFAGGIAALLHDFRHMGVNNNFLVDTSHPVALRYSDDSVLERLHACEALTLLQKFMVLDFLETRKARRAFRRDVLSMILATDFARGQATSNQLRAALTVKDDDSAKAETVRVPLLNLMLECADISHPAKPIAVHRRWALLVAEEFFEQGEAEKKASLPVGDLMSKEKMSGPAWAKSLDGFITYAVLPKWQALTDLCGLTTTWTDALTQNRDYWRAQSTKADSSFEATRAMVIAEDGTFAASLRRRPRPWKA